MPSEGDRLRPKQVATYLTLSTSTLAKWRMRGKGPPFHYCGSKIVYYLMHEIDAWLHQCDAEAED
jgi:predicted DNA-binding transcriptional regulator AlpA